MDMDPQESGVASAGGAPENLNLGRVQLQSVGLHPGSNIVGTPGKAVSKGRNVRRSTGTVNLSVISITMKRKHMTPNERK